jgi:subtilase family serine protease
VLDVPANRLYVLATGTAAQAQAAFDVAIDRVRVDGRTFDAPAAAARVPTSLAGVVAGVRGLDTGDQAHVDSVLPPPAFVNAPPCSSSYGEKVATGLPAAFGSRSFPWAPCGYGPQQLHSAYGLNGVYAAGVDGRGVTVAIIDPFDSPRQEQDTNTYSARHGLPPAELVRVTDPVATLIPTLPGGLIDPDSATQEETLDIEAVHTMAPGAKIVYEASDSLLNISLQVAQNDVVDNRRAEIVSNSYGGRADAADPNEDAIFMQAAAEGIGFYFSSGDEGDETLDPNGPGDRETDALANNPWVTTVGGTSMAINSSGGVDWQTYWGNRTSTLSGGAWSPPQYYAGGGGGTSQAYAEPDYQKGVVPGDLAGFFPGKLGRVEPDISMLGDPNTGMIVGDTQDFTVFKNPLGLQLPTDDVHYGEFRIGGTSLSAPLFAGLIALADQAAGTPHGFLNPALYAAYKADPAIAQDITASSVKRAVVRNNYVNQTDASGGTQTVLRDFDVPLTLHDRSGFDDATGMGSPNGLHFLHALAPGSTLLPPDAAVASRKTEGRARIRGPRRPTCVRGGKLTFRLRAAAGHRIVKAVAYVNGRRKLTRTGHNLKRVVVRRPSRGRVRIRIVVTSDSGRRTTFSKAYRACARRRS